MQVTTRGRYAVRAMMRLATSGDGEPVAVQEIAGAEAISPAYLEQLFLRLCEADVVKSTRGAGGGFLLNRDPADVSVKNILDAVGEGVELTPCSKESADSTCPRAAGCAARRMWMEAADHLRSYFSGITLEKLVRDSDLAGPDPAAGDRRPRNGGNGSAGANGSAMEGRVRNGRAAR